MNTKLRSGDTISACVDCGCELVAGVTDKGADAGPVTVGGLYTVAGGVSRYRWEGSNLVHGPVRCAACTAEDALLGECLYCGHTVAQVEVTDWDAEAKGHAPDCEFVATHGFRLGGAA